MPVVQVGPQPVKVVDVADPEGVVFNRSITTTVFWGYTASQANRADASILDPNATLAVDNKAQVWMTTGPGGPTVAVDYHPNSLAFFRGITQGLGALQIPSIFSPNFVTGLTGWSINKDGSGEFNNLTVRGVFRGTGYILNAAGEFGYTGVPAAGNLKYSNTNSTGTEGLGNNYLSGLTIYDNVAHIAVNINGQAIIWYSFTPQPGAVFTQLDSSVTPLAHGSANGLQVEDFLEIVTITTPTGTVFNPVLFGTAAGDFRYISGLDNGTYEIGHQENASATAVTLTTSPQVVASIPATGPFRYHVTAWTHFTGGTGLGTASFGFDGTAVVSHADWNVQEVQNGAAGPLLNNVGGGAAIPLFTTPALANGIGYSMLFDLVVTFSSSSGTFNLRGQVSVANTATNAAAFIRVEQAP